MNDKLIIMNNKSIFGNIISWLFGVAVLAAGVINMFWGNDPEFGVFISLLAFVYFPTVTAFVKKLIGFSVPLFLKVILAIFIIWATFGVGELFDKIDMMMRDL